MLSNKFIYLISLFVAIQGAKPQIIIDPITCAPYRLTVRFSLEEMVDLSNTAYERTDSLYNPGTSEDELRAVMKTVNAYFATRGDNEKTDKTTKDLLSKSFLNEYLYS